MPGERKVGQDHDHYVWSPIVKRPALRWPDSARVALCVIVNVEHFDWKSTATIPAQIQRPMAARGGTGAQFPNFRAYSHRAYGNRVGVFRVLEILDKYGIKPTVAIDASSARLFPFIIKECQRRGAEFIGHGASLQNIIHADMSEQEERSYIHDSIEAVAKGTGQRPVGWLSPEYNESMRTPKLLASEGIRYLCDWPNDEQPYPMTASKGGFFSLPVHLNLDDIFAHWNGGLSVMEYGDTICDAFDELYRSGAKSGRTLVLNIHPWLTGQPFRSKYLDMALAHIAKRKYVWKATGREIIDWYAAHSTTVKRA